MQWAADVDVFYEAFLRLLSLPMTVKLLYAKTVVSETLRQLLEM